MNLEALIQLVIAVLFGAVIGLEREFKGKEAGLQTYSLVSLGSCLLIMIGISILDIFSSTSGVSFDPLRLILAVATGIGFIGGGVIIHKEAKVEGITTAAGLWAAAAIGVAVGVKLYFIAFTALILSTVILIGFGELEKHIFNNRK